MRGLLFTLLLVFTPSVIAADNVTQECNFGTLEQMQKDKNCKCSKVRPSKIFIPKGVKFLGVCGLQIHQAGTKYEEIWGEFFYKTNKIIVGTVKYESADAGDLYFDVKTEVISSNFDGYFKFASTELEMRKLKVPLNPEATCVIAEATIKVKRYFDFLDGGTDSMGRYLDIYDVIRIGEFKVCKSTESGYGEVKYLPIKKNLPKSLRLINESNE